jgi:hypothetical protein
MIPSSSGAPVWRQTGSGKQTGFLSHLYIKVNILPRQARDKHRENSKKARFLAGTLSRW